MSYGIGTENSDVARVSRDDDERQGGKLRSDIYDLYWGAGFCRRLSGVKFRGKRRPVL